MKIRRYLSFINENINDSEKNAWWEKNSQRLIYWTGNPDSYMLAIEKDPSVKETWVELDEEAKAKLLMDLFSTDELERELLAFEDTDD